VIFQPALARAVAAGRKTQTRRPVKGDKPCRYRVGSDYAVQPGRGKEAIARLKVLEVREEPVGAITHADARAEGFRNVAAFKAAWVRIHDAGWVGKLEADITPELGGCLSESELVYRFEVAHAHKLVHVISFTLAVDTPRFLAHPTANSGDYTEQRHRAIDDLEVVDEMTQHRYAEEARKQRESFRRDLEIGRQAQKNARRDALFRRAA
jgi:hypothetical protein